MTKKYRKAVSFAASTLMINSAFAATPAVLDFDYAHATVLSDQYLNTTVGDFDYGIRIAASGGPGTAITYDSELGGANGSSINGEDTDLERLVSGGTAGDINENGWDGGNLGADFNAGGLLIVQENSAEPGGEFNPDDRAGAGSDSIITFTVDDTFSYNNFQLTLVDFEEPAEIFEITLRGFDGNGGVSSVPFLTFQLSNLIALDSTIEQGNNFINLLPEISELDGFTGERIAEVEINFGEASGAISQVVFSEIGAIPEPSSALLVLLGISSTLLRRNRQ